MREMHEGPDSSEGRFLDVVDLEVAYQQHLADLRADQEQEIRNQVVARVICRAGITGARLSLIPFLEQNEDRRWHLRPHVRHARIGSFAFSTTWCRVADRRVLGTLEPSCDLARLLLARRTEEERELRPSHRDSRSNGRGIPYATVKSMADKLCELGYLVRVGRVGRPARGEPGFKPGPRLLADEGLDES